MKKKKKSARWQQGPTDEIETRVKKWTILCLPTSQTHLNSLLFTKLVKVVDLLNQSQAQVFFPSIPPHSKTPPLYKFLHSLLFQNTKLSIPSNISLHFSFKKKIPSPQNSTQKNGGIGPFSPVISASGNCFIGFGYANICPD